MPTARREVIWIHALHGFLRGPEDFEELSHSLEAAFIAPPSDPDSLNWSLHRDVELDPSVRLRLVAWDLRSWLSQSGVGSLSDLAQKFSDAFESVLDHPVARTKESKSVVHERHILLGEGLGARVVLQSLCGRIRAHEQACFEATHPKKGGRKKQPPAPPRLPWDRVLLLGAHPGILNLQDRRQRQELENQWARRFIKEPLEQVRSEWFQQIPYSTSPRMLQALHSEAKSWKQFMPPERLAEVTEHFLLGRQEDFRESLQQFKTFGEETRFLWVTGERDRKFVGILHELQDLGVPGEFWMCPDSGHAVHLDAPADLAEKIRFFLV